MGFYENMKVSRPTLAMLEEQLNASNDPYHPLHLVLSYLRYLYLLHQTNHWTSNGDSFYGDHLLFQRMYEGISEEIDGIAEKAIGLGDSQLVNLSSQITQLFQMCKVNERHLVIPRSDELVDSSLVAETTFLCFMKLAKSRITEYGAMTSGLDNMLAGIEDKHEGFVYLLKQRSVQNFSV